MGETAEKTVVVVDDDVSMCSYLSQTLTLGGYECETFPNGAAALRWLASTSKTVDLLLSDVSMPGMTGLDLLRTVKAVTPDLPFILVSGTCDLPVAQGALRAGATDYLLKPVRPDDLISLVSKHLYGLQAERLSAVKQALQQTLGGSSPGGSDRASQLLPIFNAMGIKRFETLQHSCRVSAFTLLMARDLRMSGDARKALEAGALLHDIGKAGTPHNLLMKPGKLNEAEWAIMKLHPQLGLDLLSAVPAVERESELVYCHHKRFDGTGYPRGLARDAIPLSARIFAIADVLDALTSARCYRRSITLSQARSEIRRQAETHFDPAVLNLFDRVTDHELQEVRQRFSDF
jgi:putative nucleotidyltransferase with HDIG domain